MDAPGEWHQNGATLFYMPPAGVDPSTLTLQAANVANAFNFQNVSYFRVENLSLEKYASNATSSGISAPNTTRNDGLQFQNVRTVFSYGTGISLNSTSNARIENCQVLDAQYEGINIQNCTGTELLNTAIRRTGLVPGLQYRAGGGIIVRSVSSTVQGSNNHVANCVIDSSGKHGIRLEESLITVEKTVIKNSALNSSDIGGIYLISATCKNVTLRQNFISDTKSYTGGLPPNAINLAATQKGADKMIRTTPFEYRLSFSKPSANFDNIKFLNLGRTFGTGKPAVAYALSVIESPVDTTLTLQISHNDGLTVWVNQGVVYEQTGDGPATVTYRERAIDLAREFPIRLKKGPNRLLLKSETAGRSWAFYLRPKHNLKGLQLRPDLLPNVGSEVVGLSNLAPTLRGWQAIAGMIEADGTLHGTCIGTNMSENIQDYYTRPVADDDTHGVLPVLFAGIEVDKLIKTGVAKR